MPEISIKNMKRHEVVERLVVERPEWTQQYAHYVAGKLKRLVQRRDLGWFEGLRILGMVTDTTARDAVRNLETVAA